jgi:hypothetical protein
VTIIMLIVVILSFSVHSSHMNLVIFRLHFLIYIYRIYFRLFDIFYSFSHVNFSFCICISLRLCR